MGKKNIIYVVIFFLIAVFFLYFKYPKEEKIVKIEADKSETIIYNSNIIEDVYYS